MARSRRSIAALFIALLLLLLFAQPASAASAKQIVKVGYFLHDGYQNKSADGVYSGYSYEYLQKISEYADVRYEYVEGTWAECLQWLKEGKIDLLGFMMKTDEREKLYDFPDWSCGYNTTKLLTLKENDTLAGGDFENFNGIRVGFVENSEIIHQFSQYAKAHSFTYQEVLYPTQEAVTSALKNGEVDAVCVSNVVVPEWEREISVFNPEPIYYAVTKGNTELLSKLNSAIGQIKMSDSTFEQGLRESYYEDDTSGKVVFSEKEKSYLAGAGPITVALGQNDMPIEGFDEKNESPKGFMADLFAKISSMSGLQFKYIGYGSYSAAVQNINSGEYEILSTANQSILENADTALSNIFLRATIVLLGDKSSSFAGGQNIRIVLTPKNTFLAAYLQNLYPRCQILYCETLDKAVRMVSSGEADLMTCNVYSAQAEILLDNPNLRVVYDTGHFSDYRFAFSEAAPAELVSIINKCIGAIPASEMNAMLTAAMMGSVGSEKSAVEVLAIVILVIAIASLAAFFFIKLRKSKKNLISLAYYDPLTGAANLSKFKIDAQKQLRMNPEQGYVIDVMDIKNFQLINELYGYDAGDKLLCAIADHLRAVLDERTEAFGRIGDDEFAILLAAENEQALFARADESFSRLLSNSRKFIKQQIVFIRGYYFLQGETDLVAALEKAMLAHKKAKSWEKPVVLYDAHMKQEILREQQLEDRMESALENREFKLFLQPQYRVCDETVSGAEALVRWVTSEGVTIYPNEFIPLFERNGFVRKLDYYMFELACEKMREWIENGRRPVTISVNFSRSHLSDENWVSELAEIAGRYAVPKALLEIEITERTAIEREDVLVDLIGQIHKAGFKVSIDDFGSGHSSLGILQSLEVDTLKLDKSFFHTQTNIPRAKAVVASIIQMAKVLRMSTVAEGVEREDQVQFLRNLDCDTIQGFYYARPMPADEVTLLL